ncbi:hypothetical protein CRG98_043493 [Punica granatum]|uniref:Uncharacterized protein n=1 Tax=Punica granatum TaxID=22663 RepID=A0A2I0HWN3_PUNGR|nr:hypothetical protein CRG98_043493 [Punica granatum]
MIAVPIRRSGHGSVTAAAASLVAQPHAGRCGSAPTEVRCGLGRRRSEEPQDMALLEGDETDLGDRMGIAAAAVIVVIVIVVASAVVFVLGVTRGEEGDLELVVSMVVVMVGVVGMVMVISFHICIGVVVRRISGSSIYVREIAIVVSTTC